MKLLQLVTWLKAHPLIKISALERECGIPQGALNKALNGNTAYLSAKHLPKLLQVLVIYGYHPKD